MSLHRDRFRAHAWRLIAAASLVAAGIALSLSFAPVASARRHEDAVHARAIVPNALDGTHWVAAWGASPQPATSGNLSAGGFDDQTIRNIVFTSVGGTMVRVRFTNTFGTRPLEIGRAAIGLAGAGASVDGPNHPLSFSGHQSVLIAPGAEALSDPVDLAVPARQRLAISVFLPQPTGPATQHALARQVNYLAAGGRALDRGAAVFSAQSHSWYFTDGVEVLSPPDDLGTIVALGDSITDGVGSTTNANARWPNDLARRLDALGNMTMSVIDEGIGGNRVLNSSACCGTSAETRFDQDVLEQPDVKAVILLEGINDIGFSQDTSPATAPHTNVSAQQIIAGYQQIISRAHAAGLKIFAATLTPFKGSRHWTPAGEAKRDTINEWIRTSGAFDGVIDFANAVADPNDPEILNPAYDSGDHLHPNDAGYQAMANTINLAMLLDASRPGPIRTSAAPSTPVR